MVTNPHTLQLSPKSAVPAALKNILLSVAVLHHAHVTLQ